MKKLLFTLIMTLLAGCASGPYIDKTHSALGQSSRVRFIVIHYTVSDLARSIKILTEQQVSSHYLLSDNASPVIYGLVDESRSAYHAGVSSWKAYTQLNNSSIGIEIVNPGFSDGPDGPGSRVWHPYPQAQIDQLIALLKQIVARHGVKPENILAHSDIAPQRKTDPGPLFPWRQLASAGLITWPDPAAVALALPVFEQALPDVAWFQQKLAQHGYAVAQGGELDEATRNVIIAFQMKYRPAIFDGEPDAGTAALLEVLTAPVPKPADTK